MRLSIDHIQSERLPHLSLRVNHLELPRLLWSVYKVDSTSDNKQTREFKFQCSSSLLVNTIKIEICSNEICSKTIQKKSGECTSNECASVSVETVWMAIRAFRPPRPSGPKNFKNAGGERHTSNVKLAGIRPMQSAAQSVAQVAAQVAGKKGRSGSLKSAVDKRKISVSLSK